MRAGGPAGLRALGDVQLMLVLPGLRLVLQTRQGLPDAQLRRMRRAMAGALGLLEHQVLVVSPAVDLVALLHATPEPRPAPQAPPDEAAEGDDEEAEPTQVGRPGRGGARHRSSPLAPPQPEVDEALTHRLAELARALATQQLEALG